MGLLGKKEKTKTTIIKKKETPAELTALDAVCKDDKEVCEALKDFMFYDPRKIKTNMEDAVERAKEYEKDGKIHIAKMWYRVAGGLAIYKGDVAKVKLYLGKYAKLANNEPEPTILKIPEKAVKKAQEFYSKHLKQV